MGDKFPIGGNEGGRVFAGGFFLTEAFVLNHLPYLKWDLIYQMVQKNSQLMVLMELLRKMKVYQHVQSSFHLYFWHLNELLQLLNPSLYFSLKIKFSFPHQNKLLLLFVMIMSSYILLDLIVLSFPSSRLICYYSP